MSFLSAALKSELLCDLFACFALKDCAACVGIYILKDPRHEIFAIVLEHIVIKTSQGPDGAIESHLHRYHIVLLKDKKAFQVIGRCTP